MEGGQQLVLAACKSGAPPAPSASKAVARFAYEWSRLCQVPDLKYLPTQLCHYVHEYPSLGKKLGLPWKPEEDSDLDHALRAYLVTDNDNCEI